MSNDESPTLPQTRNPALLHLIVVLLGLLIFTFATWLFASSGEPSIYRLRIVAEDQSTVTFIRPPDEERRFVLGVLRQFSRVFYLTGSPPVYVEVPYNEVSHISLPNGETRMQVARPLASEWHVEVEVKLHRDLRFPFMAPFVLAEADQVWVSDRIKK
jgi:hypothetical protein